MNKTKNRLIAICRVFCSSDYIVITKNCRYDIVMSCEAIMTEAYLSEPLKECIKLNRTESTSE
jgi:hypothetical protein